MTASRPILPGRAIGILGGGQLGRMFAIAARRMGYRVHAFDPTADCPTGQVADVEVNAAYDDIEAAVRFAEAVDVVTFEFENIPAETLAAIERVKPVHPSPLVLDTCRHRLREKRFLSSNDFPVTEFHEIHSAQELHRAITTMNSAGVLKSADFGYDGKGQARVKVPDDADGAWKTVNRPVCVLEKWVHFDFELSVIVARGADGRSVPYMPIRNDHSSGILDISTAPANLSAKVARDATDLAVAIAERLSLVGVIAVEMFAVGDSLLVNELAPRPHNSGHLTLDACVTSQFEQQLRAVCHLPLGDPTLLRPVAMANLLGDLWNNGEPDWLSALTPPTLKLHLYGKHTPAPGRKMGHLTATAASPEAARELVLAARSSLVRAR